MDFENFIPWVKQIHGDTHALADVWDEHDFRELLQGGIVKLFRTGMAKVVFLLVDIK